MKIYNTLTNTKEEFKPITPGQVTMYVCGPTVYNYIHIGNARSVIAFDTIRRYLEFRDFRVNFVSNFTDVDDKMIAEAKAENVTVPELAERYIKAYREDIAALNVEPATLNPRATHEITAIIKFNQKLIAKGYAYESDGDVYFHTRKFKHYGALSSQKIWNFLIMKMKLLKVKQQQANRLFTIGCIMALLQLEQMQKKCPSHCIIL